MSSFAQTIDDMQAILGVCPCCGEIFRLIDAKFAFPKKRPRNCDYLELLKQEQAVSNDEEQLELAELRFEDRLQAQRLHLIAEGREAAKKRLKVIDPTFSGCDVDPQDVKVIFDPVEYIIFCGLNSEQGTEAVELVSRAPESRLQETIVKSIAHRVANGDIHFETLHMKDDGSFLIKKKT